MIPVEDSACGTAFVSHDQSERTPDQYTNQIAYVKYNAGHQKKHLSYDTAIIQNP